MKWIYEMVSLEVVTQLYSHAAVFACPSVYEPFGLINLEAMACETPVVASAVGGILEVVEDGKTGLLVPPARPDALAEALARVLGDPGAARAMGRAGPQARRGQVQLGRAWPRGPSRSTRTRSTSSSARRATERRARARVRGFVFDLDGCVWNGNMLNPGAARDAGRVSSPPAAASRSSPTTRAPPATSILERLHALGVTVAEHALTPLEIIGIVIRERFGISRVLVIGAAEMADGHRAGRATRSST